MPLQRDIRSLPAHEPQGETTSIATRFQQAAAKHVATHWTADLGPVPSSAEIDAVMSCLVAGVLEMQVTESAVIDARVRSPLGRRLLIALRADMLRGWQGAGISERALGTLLTAFERVHDTIVPDPAQSFAARLAGRDGLRLLSDVAHDLRSPLTSILFLAETLQRGQSGAVTDVQRRQLGLIYTAALGLSSVASDIIDLTRSELLVELKPVPFSVRGILESVQDIVRPIAEEKQLALRLSAPKVDARLGHPVALGRVLLNLMTNALRFTSQGYVGITITDISPARVDISVNDSGKGIDPAIMPTLFDPVRRAKASGGREDNGGKLFSQTGLGLTICRKLVALMGAELKVESRVGWGTRFYFELELPPCPSTRSESRAGAGAQRRAGDRRDRRAERRTSGETEAI